MSITAQKTHHIYCAHQKPKGWFFVLLFLLFLLLHWQWSHPQHTEQVSWAQRERRSLWKENCVLHLFCSPFLFTPALSKERSRIRKTSISGAQHRCITPAVNSQGLMGIVHQWECCAFHTFTETCKHTRKCEHVYRRAWIMNIIECSQLLHKHDLKPPHDPSLISPRASKLNKKNFIYLTLKTCVPVLCEPMWAYCDFH